MGNQFRYRCFTVAALASVLTLVSGSVSAVEGEISEFRTKSGVVERCVRMADFPAAHYSGQDRADEAKYCGLDFSQLALCPKLWSTSPGTILYEIDAAAYEGDYTRFERQHCAEGFHTAEAALGRPANFKISVNARDSSATYAPSSWVYYHLSRYFQTNVYVPVAVYRSMETTVHNARVTKPALGIVGDRHNLRMLAAGWRFLDAVENGQDTGRGAVEALTDDGRQIFGVLLNSKGDRYGAEFNGTRESGWGAGQNQDFQQTAPFLALRNNQPVVEAARAAIHDARKNPQMAKALPADTPVEQVILWMQDVLEITLLDFMLGQQDRIGNIDYNWSWYWVDGGKLESRFALSKEIPVDLVKFNPLRLRQSAINDNDAGVRAGYANFAASTHMLEGLHHYNANLYQRLGHLAADLKIKGGSYSWLTKSAGLNGKEADVIAKRASEAFELLQADCKSGVLKLDLEPARQILPATNGESAANDSCAINEE